MFDIGAVQKRLREMNLDGWLLYDFRGANYLAVEALSVATDAKLSRRWFYFVPADGEPTRLVHRMEHYSLDHLPGRQLRYLAYAELRAALAELLEGAGRVAMEYSPEAANPYVGVVDAGTVELVRSCGVDVVGSGDLIQHFQARWPEAAYPLYRRAAETLMGIKDEAWRRVSAALRSGEPITEQDVARFIIEQQTANGLVVDPPIVGAGENSGNPHYDTIHAPERAIGPDEPLLIDLYTRVDHADATVADFTYMAWTGATPDPAWMELWRAAAGARDAALALVRERIASGSRIEGWEVDKASRDVIVAAGHADSFVHRTGHSLGRQTHGSGVHADNLEMRDERALIPGIAFTIEPGIYLVRWGVRTEINVLVHDGEVEVWEDPPQVEPARLG